MYIHIRFHSVLAIRQQTNSEMCKHDNNRAIFIEEEEEKIRRKNHNIPLTNYFPRVMKEMQIE